MLGGLVGGGLVLLGVAEMATRLDEPGPLLFWLPTLWGGGALVLTGVFGMRGHPQRALVCVILGAVLGLLPSMWTVVMPLLSIALVVVMVRDTTGDDPAPAGSDAS